MRAISRVAPPRDRIRSSASSFIRLGSTFRFASTSIHAAGSPVRRSISSAIRSVSRAFILACTYHASQRSS